ncbi:type II secretion system protein N [Roseovarius marisflavi]|nr:type II secretion system protein N [Roseovarius marisflavi]
MPGLRPNAEAHMSETTQTPEATLAAATTQDALPNARLSLLGTVLKPDMSHALFRIGRSKVERVTIGDAIDGATVTAIGEGVVMLSRAGHSERLSLPAS